MICGKCGKTIPEDAVFCSYCGTRCGEKVCVVCGTKLRSDQLFCHECGVKCDSDKPQDAERPQVEAPDSPEKPKVQRLYIFRKWQAGTSEMIFQIHINGIRRGNVGAGESLSVDIVTDETLMIEIRGYDKSRLQVRRIIILKDMDNPRVYLSMPDGVDWGENGWSPKLEVTAKGAKVYQNV